MSTSAGRFSITFLVYLALLGLATLPVLAQDADIRLSYDLLQPVLPADAQIHAADSIGEMTLVVWGSTAYSADSSIQNVLWMQLVHRNKAVEAPRRLTGQQAHPSGIVQVLGLAGRFLVVWNDHRDGEARAYIQRVAMHGEISPEELLDAQAAVTAQPIAWGARLQGYDLLWNGTNGEIRARRSGTATEFLEPARTIMPGSFARALHPDSYPGITLLDRGGDGWAILFRDDSIHTFSLPYPYHVGRDGSLAAINGNQVTTYESIIRPQIKRSFMVPLPDTALSGSPLIGHNSAGQIIITYAVIHGDTLSRFYNTMYLDSYRIIETAPGQLSEPHLIERTELLSVAKCNALSISMERITIQRACNNRSLSTYPYAVRITPDSTCPIADTYVRDTVVLVFTDSVVFSPSHQWPYTNYDPCRSEPAITLVRTAAESHSRVAVIGSDTVVVRLSAPVAMARENVAELNPALAYQGGSLLIAWRTAGTAAPLAIIGAWNPLEATVREVDRLLVGDPDDRSIGSLLGTTGWTAQNRSELIDGGGGGAVLAANTRWRGEFQQYAREWDEKSYHQMTASGWRRIELGDRPELALWSTPLSVNYNPDERTTLFAMQHVDLLSAEQWSQLVLWDSLGNEVWRTDSMPWIAGHGLQFIPLGDSQSVAVYLNGMQLVNGSTPGSRSTAVGLRQGSSAPFIKLYGAQMLQPYERYPEGVFLEIIDTTFHVVATSPPLPHLPMMPSPPFDAITMLQHPRDSGIIILYGDMNGIRMDLFDTQLDPQQSGIRISTTTTFAGGLAAVMRDDSLVVVWKDTRNGAGDIYGRALRLPTTASVEREKELPNIPGASLHITAVPNPASQTVLFTWKAAGSSGDALITIRDMLGRDIARFTAAATTGYAHCNIADLAAGIYHVMVSIGHRHGAYKLIRQ